MTLHLRWITKSVFLISFIAGSRPAYCKNCAKISSHVELAVCSDAELLRMNGDLKNLYSSLVIKLTSRARIALAKQQRAWLAARSQFCTTADDACLRQRYQLRIGQLEALNASADIGDDPLDDITPVVLSGKWKITSIYDPAGSGHTDGNTIQDSLKSDNLPALGETIGFTPGKWCWPSYECETIGWLIGRLGKELLGEAIEGDLRLGPTTKILIGSYGKYSHYVMVPRPDGTLWAVFGLCNHNSGDCREAAEVWTPASADAAVSPTPKFAARSK